MTLFCQYLVLEVFGYAESSFYLRVLSKISSAPEMLDNNNNNNKMMMKTEEKEEEAAADAFYHYIRM